MEKLKENCELIFLFGLGDNFWLDDGKKFSRNYKQGYRVYDSRGSSVALTASGGGMGGVSGMYLVKRRIKERK